MAISIEKLREGFLTLNPREKVQFLKTVIAAPPGEWIETEGRIHFIPEGLPATEEEETVFARANREIDNGRGVSLDELKRGWPGKQALS